MQSADAVNVAGLTVSLARKRRLTDAAFYFLASVFSYSKEPMDLHPRYGMETVERADNPMHRVWEAQGLFAAFRAIEALGLTVIGASGKRPSVGGGVWDTEIRGDLENRLQRAGISSKDTFVWHSRGRLTATQRKLRARTSSTNPAPWSGGNIRDEKIPYVDAINHAQWLRSSAAAHQTKRGLRGLHPIDTVNVQLLARMLVLKAAKFGRAPLVSRARG